MPDLKVEIEVEVAYTHVDLAMEVGSHSRILVGDWGNLLVRSLAEVVDKIREVLVLVEVRTSSVGSVVGVPN